MSANIFSPEMTKPLKKLRLILWPLLLLCLLSPLSFAQDDDDDFFIFDEEEEVLEIADPFENINRAIFAFNDKAYRGFLKPVAVGYRVVPEPVRNSISNVFLNLRTPVSAVNALLQLDLPNAGTEFSRFLINSTIGVLGLFDPATALGIDADNEDLGQTFAHYGIGHGFYMVVPFFGSYSLRDGVGRLGNFHISPVFQAWEPGLGEFLAYRLLEAETNISLDEDTYEAFYQSALDPYAFFRSAYVQSRQGEVEQ